MTFITRICSENSKIVMSEHQVSVRAANRSGVGRDRPFLCHRVDLHGSDPVGPVTQSYLHIY